MIIALPAPTKSETITTAQNTHNYPQTYITNSDATHSTQDKNSSSKPPTLTSVWLAELTWNEVQNFLDSSSPSRILIPTAGIEQNGWHLPLGKHHVVIEYTAKHIASRLGNTVIAPVIDYVPEQPHMGFAGTISVRESTFYNLLQDIIESLVQHGFSHIYLLGDSYGNQMTQAKIAKELSKKYRYANVTIHHLHDYYAANGQHEWLKLQGYSDSEIGNHAAIRDSSEIMAINPDLVRSNYVGNYTTDYTKGANGNSTKASAAIGNKMLELKINAAINEIMAIETKKY